MKYTHQQRGFPDIKARRVTLLDTPTPSGCTELWQTNTGRIDERFTDGRQYFNGAETLDYVPISEPISLPFGIRVSQNSDSSDRISVSIRGEFPVLGKFESFMTLICRDGRYVQSIDEGWQRV